MAYSFTAASLQYFTTATTPVSAAPLTFACWFAAGSGTTGQTLISIGDTGGTANWFRLCVSETTAGVVDAEARQASTSQSTSAIAGFSAGQWYHGAAVFASDTSRTAYANGTAGTENTDSKIPASLDVIGIGALRRSSNTQYMNGTIADAAIWSAALTASEIASLAKGVSAAKVRPQSLVFYAPLIREAIDIKGGLALSAVNTPTVAAHPRIYL